MQIIYFWVLIPRISNEGVGIVGSENEKNITKDAFSLSLMWVDVLSSA